MLKLNIRIYFFNLIVITFFNIYNQLKEKINKDKEKQYDSWQKPKVKKEVPEDVLRRVLE